MNNRDNVQNFASRLQNFLNTGSNMFQYSSIQEAAAALRDLDTAAMAEAQQARSTKENPSKLVTAKDILIRELNEKKTGHIDPRKSWMVLDGIRKAQRTKPCVQCKDKTGDFDMHVHPVKIGWRCGNKHFRWC